MNWEELERLQGEYLAAQKALEEEVRKTLFPAFAACKNREEVLDIRNQLWDRRNCDTLDGPIHLCFALAWSRFES